MVYVGAQYTCMMYKSNDLYQKTACTAVHLLGLQSESSHSRHERGRGTGPCEIISTLAIQGSSCLGGGREA